MGDELMKCRNFIYCLQPRRLVDEMPQFHLGPGPEEDEPPRGPDRVMKTANFIYSAAQPWAPRAVHDPALCAPEPGSHEGGGGSHAAKAEGGSRPAIREAVGSDLTGLHHIFHAGENLVPRVTWTP